MTFMNEFQKIFKDKIVLAPMEDVSEPPFRLICKRNGADIVYTEFISSEGLIRDAAKSREKLFMYEEERPVAIQIFGGNDDSMIEAAKISESAGPDFIDINCGCWVKNVAMRGAGAGLLKDLPKMRQIAESIVQNVKLPVTLKTRLGWDEKSTVIVDVARIMEDIGIQALTVHCRWRSQGNKGDADWEWVKRIKDSGIQIPIILNGNIKTPEDVKYVFETFEPDAVMIGQAAMLNPFIFRQVKYYLAHGVHEPEPELSEKIDTCLEHLRLCCEWKPEKLAVKEFRKFYSGYLRNLRDINKFRIELMALTTYKEVEEKLLRFKEENAGMQIVDDKE
jgi:nifR3 family TIM-barrel protein